MGLGSHGIFVPGHKSRDLRLGLGLILLGRLGLEQISLGQSKDKKSLGQPNPKLWDHLGPEMCGE